MIKGVINHFRKATWLALVVHGVPAVAIVAAAVGLVAAAGVEYWASTAKPGLGNVPRSVSVILFGVGWSVIASAMYVIFSEVARAWHLKPAFPRWPLADWHGICARPQLNQGFPATSYSSEEGTEWVTANSVTCVSSSTVLWG
jgi:hypothetical protein